MRLKSIIESILFVNEKPILSQEIARALDLENKQVLEAIEELKSDYAGRDSGLCIVKVAKGYQLCTDPQNNEWVRKLYKKRFKRRLSPASLEVLAMVAYKQPVTKIEIESIRGVNCDQVIKNLLNLGLLKITGKKDVIGKPFLYSTSRKFLEYFGLNSLRELPDLDKQGLYSEKLQDFSSLEPEEQQSETDSPDQDDNSEVLQDRVEDQQVQDSGPKE
jgi:segregation and condensation protein B